jgi:hypothetical protein
MIKIFNPDCIVHPCIEPHGDGEPEAYGGRANIPTLVLKIISLRLIVVFGSVDSSTLKEQSSTVLLIQLALLLTKGHSNGTVGALIHKNHTVWICQNLIALFHDDGPLSMFSPHSEQGSRDISPCPIACSSLFNHDNSNNPIGAGRDDVTQWYCLYFK